MFVWVFFNISASKGFRKPFHAWGRKKKANWTTERYRRWNWIARSWGMAICTVLLYLAYFYGKSKFDLVLVLPWSKSLRYETKAGQIQLLFVFKNEFSLASLLTLRTLGHAWPQKSSRTWKLDIGERSLRRTLSEKDDLFSLHKIWSYGLSEWLVL